MARRLILNPGTYVGTWEILSHDNNYTGHQLRYKAKCECGEIRIKTKDQMKASRRCIICTRKSKKIYIIDNYIGKKFNSFTVIGPVDDINSNPLFKKSIHWKVQCNCGRISNRRAYEIVNRRINECQTCSNNKLKITEGYRFGSRIVIKFLYTSNSGHSYLCRCDCGKETIATGYNILRKKPKNCKYCIGKHGATKKTARPNGYTSWCTMKQRCYNPNSQSYDNYGGRGITVCDRWKNNFSNFIADMGERPPGYQLDRIDNEGNYEPSNCRWVTPYENTSNRRFSLKNRNNYIIIHKNKLCNNCRDKHINKFTKDKA